MAASGPLKQLLMASDCFRCGECRITVVNDDAQACQVWVSARDKMAVVSLTGLHFYFLLSALCQ